MLRVEEFCIIFRYMNFLLLFPSISKFLQWIECWKISTYSPFLSVWSHFLIFSTMILTNFNREFWLLKQSLKPFIYFLLIYSPCNISTLELCTKHWCRYVKAEKLCVCWPSTCQGYDQRAAHSWKNLIVVAKLLCFADLS